MKQLYFVRHAEPEHGWADDRTRPLSVTGLGDCAAVTRALRGIQPDRYVSSPYRRSYDTVRKSAEDHGVTILTDERLRERKKGPEGNTWELFGRRWDDFDFQEEGGESLRSVQRRNMDAVFELLDGGKPDETIVIGTHGTALSTILNYFDPALGFESFKRIIDFMPYIVRLEFERRTCLCMQEILAVKRPLREGLRNSEIAEKR